MRYITGFIGFPIVVAVFWFGDIRFIDAIMAIITIMSLHEYFDSMKEKAKPIRWIGYIACILIAFIHIIPKEYFLTIIGILIPLSILILFTQIIVTNMKYNIIDIAVTFFGICYIPLFMMFIPLIIGRENGKILIWYGMFAAWGTDVFAYLFGRTIGKHKFSKISPNKTIEGCIGGTIGATIMILLYTMFINSQLGLNINYLVAGIIAVVLSIIGQLGDFSASSIKRYNGIKDFSNLIPGHGGMLDRIDSVIFIAPFAYFLLMLI